MAKNYIHGNPGKFIPLPSLWFDENNRNGFAGTAAWLDAVTKIRKSLPDYRENLKALGEAVAEFSEDSTIKNYSFWTGYFIERKDTNLLRAFQLFTSHYFFKIN